VVFSEAVAALPDTSLRLQRVGSGASLPAIVTTSGNTAVLRPDAPLLIGASYTVTISGSVADVAGNQLGADVAWTFSASGALTDTTAADFGGGSPDTGARIAQASNGEVVLAPGEGSEFNGSSLPGGWTSTQWTSGGSATVSGGTLTVNGMRVGPTASYAPGRSLEFVATFGADSYQHVGFGDSFNSTPWAIFSTSSGGGLYARTNNGSSEINTLVAGSWLGTSHRFRIDWGTSSVVYFIDGAQVASHAIAIATNMRPLASDYITGGSSLVVDWLWMTPPYASTGIFTSRVFDALLSANWTSAAWNADLPSGTAIVVSVRTGDTATPDGSWTGWAIVPSGGAISASSRYIQYRATLTTSDPSQSPVLRDITITGSVQ
jgi:hypothetical protein